MSSKLTTQRLIELIALGTQDPGPETDWLRDMDAAAKELLDRRKAEQCPTCEGLGILHYGSPPERACPDCGGTGKQGNAELIAALRAKLDWCRKFDDCADVQPDEYCSDECSAMARAVERAEGKRV